MATLSSCLSPGRLCCSVAGVLLASASKSVLLMVVITPNLAFFLLLGLQNSCFSFFRLPVRGLV